MKISRSLHSILQRLPFPKILMIGMIQGILVLGLSFSNTAVASISLPFFRTDQPLQQTQPESARLDEAAERADQASDKIFDGLETTKRVIGKTDVRNRVIETGRDKASRKLESIAEKARSAEKSEDSLSATEQRVVDQLQTDR